MAQAGDEAEQIVQDACRGKVFHHRKTQAEDRAGIDLKVISAEAGHRGATAPAQVKGSLKSHVQVDFGCKRTTLYLEYLYLGISLIFVFKDNSGSECFGVVRGGDMQCAADFGVSHLQYETNAFIQLLKDKYAFFDTREGLGDCLRSLAANPPEPVPPRRSGRRGGKTF